MSASRPTANARRIAGYRVVGKCFFDSERIVREPVQELEALGTDDTGLNIVDMGVDETRSDEATGMVGKRALRWQLGFQLSVRSDRLNHTVAADHEAVRLADESLVRIGENGSSRQKINVPRTALMEASPAGALIGHAS